MRPVQALSSAQAARATQAFTLLRGGDVAGALRIARELVAAAPNAPDAQQLLALSLGQSGDAQGAEQAFMRALQLAPRQPAILCNLAVLLRRLGRRDEALRHWQQAVAAAPQLQSAWLDLGLTALDLDQTEVAVTALQRAVSLLPTSVRAWHGLGNAQRKAGDLAAAELSFRKVLALDPTQRAVWVNLAAVLRLLGRPAESVECFESARRLGLHSPEVLDAMVGSLLDATRLGEAFVLARQVTREHPEFVAGHISLAHLQWEYGPPQSSGVDPLAELRQAAQAQPDNEALQIALVGFLLEAKRCEEALQRLQQLRARADHPMLVTLQANALELLDRPAESGPLYAQAHRTWGNSDPAFLNAYVRHLLKAGQWDLAAQRAQEALQTDPENQETWAYLATAWRLLGDPREEWLCDYERLIALLDVDVPDGWSDMAHFLEALGHTLDVLHQARTEPVRQSLRGGSQTPGRLFGRPEPNVVALQTVLLRSIERWLAQLPKDSTHPFLRRAARSVSFTGSWSVKLWTSGNHVNHYHSDGWMSSAFYVALPPSVRAQDSGQHAGHIQFGQPPLELGLELPPRRIIQPRVGHLALFPSYMWHGTVPFFDEQPRITVAFDMLPKA